MAITKEKQAVLALFKIEKARTAGANARAKEAAALSEFEAAKKELCDLGVDISTLVTDWASSTAVGVGLLSLTDVRQYAAKRVSALAEECRDFRDNEPEGWRDGYSACMGGMNELNLLLHAMGD